MRAIQPGRTRMVLVHVVLPIDFKVEELPLELIGQSINLFEVDEFIKRVKAIRNTQG